MKRSVPSIVAAVAIVLILVFHMVTYQVRFNEVAVVRTFGKIQAPDPVTGESPDVKTKPGLKFKWPWPIQQVSIFDNRIQLTETIGEETPTRDRKNVVVTTAVGWSIADPYVFSIRNQDMKDAERKLQVRVRNDQKTVIARYDFAHFVSTNPDELKYDDIEREIFRAIQETAPTASELFGIEVRYVGIEGLALPKQITTDVFNAMKKEREAEAARYTSEGESEANRIKAEAESIAGTILAFADRQAEQIIAEGKARAAAYNETFRKDEDLAVFLLQMDYLGKILKDRSTVVFDGHPPFDLLKEASLQGKPAAATRPAGRMPEPAIVEPK
ncbi:MAG TPA: protease modulator HflC [Phycisphaerae bacterium]|nr:protease modulator HflC [Phycisphaerae bacterium]HRR85308.1 protease modulator HflC [Phycisphaerae bacterium]